MVNTFLVKMDHDCDGVSCVTYDDHHAEIARLQADLEWMTSDRNRWQDSATRRYAEKIADRNDAIEAAAMVQVLRMEEGGSRHMSPLSAEAQSAIRALKRPVTKGGNP